MLSSTAQASGFFFKPSDALGIPEESKTKPELVKKN